MKKICIIIALIIVLLIVVTFPLKAEGETQELSPEEIIKNQLEKLDLTELQQQVDKLNKEVGDYLPRLTLQDIVKLFSKEGLKNKFDQVTKGMLRYFFKEIMANSRLLGKLIILAIIAVVLKNLQANFASRQVSNLANGLVYLVLAIIALNSFKVAVSIGKDTITNMVGIMQAILPVLLSLLVSMGHLTSASLFHPVSFLIVNSLSSVVKNIVFPLIFLAAILDIVNNISDEFKVTGLAGLLKQANLGILGVVTTIFLAAIVTQGTIATVSDGVTIRTAKYLTGSFVPIIGGFLSNALDLVIGGSLLIKNALGLFSVIIILIFCSFSTIKIVVLIFIYRLAAAVIQPVEDGKIVDCLNKLANNLLLIFGSVTVVGIMFFVVIIIVIGSANFTVMMR